MDIGHYRLRLGESGVDCCAPSATRLEGKMEMKTSLVMKLHAPVLSLSRAEINVPDWNEICAHNRPQN